MKLSLAIVAFALAVPTASFAQDSTAVVSNGEYPNTFSSGSANVSPFTNNSKRFNDWAISAGVGVPLVQHADLTSIKHGKDVFGYSAYVSIDKAITHAFGINLNMTEEKQDRDGSTPKILFQQIFQPANR
jgi:OOP family OmpA-OmpF porin